jgi:cation diffusion facilitator family transporter
MKGMRAMTKEMRLNAIKKITVQNVILNIVLFTVKITAGFFANSYSLIADSINSISNIVSSVISFSSSKSAAKQEDAEQISAPKRTEAVTALILGIIIAIFTVFAAAISFFRMIQTIGYAENTTEFWAVPIVVVIMLIKSYIYINTKNEADDIKSTSLLSVAFDFKMDIFFSVAVLLGIISSYLFDFYLEPIIALCITAVIFKSVIDVIDNALSQIANKAVAPETAENIKALALSCDGVLNISKMQIRRYARKIYIDMGIVADKSLTVKQEYDITESVRKKLENELHEVKHCMIQVDSSDGDNA